MFSLPPQSPRFQLTSGKSSLNVPVDIGTVHHYRNCEYGGHECIFQTASVADRRVALWASQLVSAVQRQLHFICSNGSTSQMCQLWLTTLALTTKTEDEDWISVSESIGSDVTLDDASSRSFHFDIDFNFDYWSPLFTNDHHWISSVSVWLSLAFAYHSHIEYQVLLWRNKDKFRKEGRKEGRKLQWSAAAALMQLSVCAS